MKIKAIFLYLGFIFWAFLLTVLLKYAHLNVTGLGITLAFLTLIFAPGVFLWRLSGQKTTSWAAKILYVIGLGFGFYFSLNLLGMIINLTLMQVAWLSLTVGILLLTLAIFRDRRETFEINFDWFKTNTLGDWILIILMVGGSVAAFFAVSAQSDKLVGDGWFHLAILQKISSGIGLNPHNLWVTKTENLNLVYAFPIWHILVALVAKILNLNFFTAFGQILLPLVVLAMLVFYSFIKIIFPSKYLTAVIYLAFLAYYLSAGIFYGLVPLRSPDSLNRLLLFPLVLGLSIQYLANLGKKVFPEVLIVVLLAIFMGLIHFTHLIDYFLILIVFSVLILIFVREKEILKRLGWLISILIGLSLLYLLVFQSQGISYFLLGNINAYSGDTFANKSFRNSNNLYLYTAFALPLLLVFYKKRRWLFLVAIALTLLAVTWQVFGLRQIFLKYLGEIFTVRAITDIPGFVFLGFILFIIIRSLGYFSEKLPKWLRYSLYALLFMVIIFAKTPIANFVDLAVFSPKNPFFYHYFWLILVISTILSIIAYLIFYFRKKTIAIEEPKEKIDFAILVILIFLILTWPYLINYQKARAANPNGSLFKNREISYLGNIERIGGKETADFLALLPSGCVMANSNVTVAQTVLLYANCFALEYPYAIEDFTLTKTLYDPQTSLQARLTFLDKYLVNYIVTLRPYERVLFENSRDFEKIYEKKFTYQVRTTKDSYQKDGEFTVFRYLRLSSYHMDFPPLKELTAEEMPYTFEDIAPMEPDFPVDQDGIILYNQQFYHPGQIAQEGLYFLESWRKTNNQEYLIRAEKYAEKLLEISKNSQGAVYFPFDFGFALHGFKDDVLKAPWYSGMVQGEALSFFVRLYQITDNEKYFETADKIFRSFQNLRSDLAQPWTVFVTRDGYYWIEEYPGDEPGQVLNGFIFGMYGLYDYYLLKKDSQSKELLDASLTTLKRYLPEFRNPGGISYYCLKHKRQNESYHQTHIKQLKLLFKITNDRYFKNMADNFYRDHH